MKIRCYRPFPHEEIWEAVKGAKTVAVMDANLSLGSEGAIGMDLKAKLYGSTQRTAGDGFHCGSRRPGCI